jgi:hypothetical protein
MRGVRWSIPPLIIMSGNKKILRNKINFGWDQSQCPTSTVLAEGGYIVISYGLELGEN